MAWLAAASRPWLHCGPGNTWLLACGCIGVVVILGVLAVAAFGVWLRSALVVAVVRPGQQGSQPDAKKAALFWCPPRFALRRRLLLTLAAARLLVCTRRVLAWCLGRWPFRRCGFGNVLACGSIAGSGKVLRFGWWQFRHLGFGRAVRCKLTRIGQHGARSDWPEKVQFIV